MSNNRDDLEDLVQRCMTASEMIEALESFPDDAPVMFTCDYGDFHHTKQVLPITSCELDSSNSLRGGSGYSQSHVKFVDANEDNHGGEVVEEWDKLENEIDIVIFE